MKETELRLSKLKTDYVNEMREKFSQHEKDRNKVLEYLIIFFQEMEKMEDHAFEIFDGHGAVGYDECPFYKGMMKDCADTVRHSML